MAETLLRIRLSYETFEMFGEVWFLLTIRATVARLTMNLSFFFREWKWRRDKPRRFMHLEYHVFVNIFVGYLGFGAFDCSCMPLSEKKGSYNKYSLKCD